MSHRTQHLPELSGIRHVWREIRYKESARQILGFVLVFVLALAGNPILPYAYIGVPLVVTGVFLRLWSSGYIMKNQKLATSGPYSMVRHPLYTGNVLLLVGFAICASLIWGFVLLALFLYVYYPTAIEYEDYKLETLFGQQWRDWSKNTPALIPNLLNLSMKHAGRWSLSVSIKRNYEPIIVIVLLGCLVFLFAK